MKRYTKPALPALVLATALILASCGGAGTGGSQQAGSDDMQGMNHGDKTGDMAGMDHSQMGHGSMGAGSNGMARQMVMENGKYSDERFIDAMVPHHQGAIEMARVALENSDNPQIKELAESIISAQQGEIEQMKQWREEWYLEG